MCVLIKRIKVALDRSRYESAKRTAKDAVSIVTELNYEQDGSPVSTMFISMSGVKLFRVEPKGVITDGSNPFVIECDKASKILDHLRWSYIKMLMQ